MYEWSFERIGVPTPEKVKKAVEEFKNGEATLEYVLDVLETEAYWLGIDHAPYFL